MSKMKLEQRLKSRNIRIALSCVGIAFLLAVSIFIRPAFSAERVLDCIQTEHTHTEECYILEDIPVSLRLSCNVRGHAHNETCVDEDGVVICGKADGVIHTHNDYCYAENELVCTLSEKTGEAHTHSDSCYTDGVLSCGKSEISAHNHSESCVDAEAPAQKSVLSCTIAEHTHGDSCYVLKSESSSEKESIISSVKPAVSGSDVSSTDTGEMGMLFSTLLLSDESAAASEDDFTIYLDAEKEYTCEVGETVKYTFYAKDSHGYMFRINIDGGKSNVRFIRPTQTSNFTMSATGTYSNSSNHINVAADSECSYEITNNGSETAVGKIFVEYADSYHRFTDGICVCGLKEEDLSGSCGANATWKFEDGVLTIKGTGAIDGASESAVPWFGFRDYITDVVIEDGITSIGYNAFMRCTSLKSVDIPDSVTSIGSYAFYTCSSLESVDLPEGIPSINTYAFCSCSSLKSIDIPDSVTSIGSKAFYGCASLESIDFSSGITTVGSEAFRGCSSLNELNISDIGAWSQINFPDSYAQPLYYASDLYLNGELVTVLDIPDSVTSIGNYAFSSCTTPDSVTIPDSVTSIGTNAFLGCSGLNDVHITDLEAWCNISFSTYSSNPFYNAENLYLNGELVTDLVIPEGVTKINSYAFYGCECIESVVIPDSVTSIGQYAFYYCTALDSVVIPDSVTSIGNNAFINCTSLESVDIPDSVTSIGNAAFRSCTSLDSVVIPDSVTSINSQVFYGCTSLESVVIPDSVTSIGSSAFQNCTALDSVVIPDSVTKIESSTFLGCISLESVVLPDSIASINSQVFYGCTSLESVVIPDNVTSINSQAFYGCTSLESVVIPDSVTSIGSSAFNSCPSLKELYLPESLTSIGDNAYTASIGSSIHINSSNLTTIGTSAILKPAELEKVSIGEKVNTISTQLADNLLSKLGADTKFEFAPDNYFTVEKDFTISSLNRTFPAGDYYVDSQGVIYLLDKETGTAQLFHIPDGVVSYTIPASVSAEDGTALTITSAAKNSLYNASDLTTLVFEAPENILSLSSGSLGNCPTLTSVNGETTVEGAYAVFTNADANVADAVFINTGLTNETVVSDSELRIYGNDDDLIPLIRVISQKNDGKNNADFADTYTYYTGEFAKVTIGLSNANAGDYAVTRVYFAFDNPGGELSWSFGEQKVQTDGGNVYTLKICKSDASGVYYIEAPRLLEGDTLSAHINVLYPSPNTGGGKARIWPVVLNADELEKIGNSVVTPTTCNEIEWVTKPDDFTLSKTNLSTPFISGVGENNELVVYNVGYTVSMSRTGNTLQGMGKDHIKYIRYTDTFTLPDGLEWDERVLDAVRSGKWGYIPNGNYNIYFYVKIDDVESAFMNLYDNDYYKSILDPEFSVTDDGKLQFSWTWANPDYNKSEITNHSFNIYLCRGTAKNNNGNISSGNTTIRPSYIKAIDVSPDETLTLTNDVSADQTFCYSENQYDEASVESSVKAGKANFKIYKSRSYSSRWGESATYTISVYNDSSFAFPDLLYVDDPLPTELVLEPSHIQSIFNSFLKTTDAHKECKVIISHATLCRDTSDAHTPGASVYAADGSVHTLTQANSGVNTQYHGCEADDPAEYDTDATLILSCTADGKQTLTYGDKVLDATDILAALEAVGYVCEQESRYTVEWHYIDDYDIPAGEHHTYTIPCHIKDSFQQLNDDEPNYRSPSPKEVAYNYAHAYHKESSGEVVFKDAYIGGWSTSRDFTLYKSGIINGDNSLENVVDGDYIDYTLGINHLSNKQYEILPLTDHMTGAQLLLVPLEGNAHLASDYGLSTREVDGETYYVFDKPGTYRKVTVGDMIADSVKVEPISGGGFDTLIHWYLTDIKGSKTKNVAFRAVVDTQVTGENDLSYVIDNETWLNDHQSHRLYDTVGDDGAFGGTAAAFNKYIVIEKGETPEDDVLATYEPFREGEPTLYRLMLKSVGDSVTLTGDDIYDKLPVTYHEAFKWSKDNVKLKYVPAEGSSFSFTGVDNAEDTWYIDTTAPAWTGTTEETDQLWIRWDSDMTLTINGTLYIYVTLDLPDGETWLDYANVYRETRLENSFYVREEKMMVYHDFVSVTEALLQKGVIETGLGLSNYGQNGSPARTTDDARHHFINRSYRYQYISYYIVLYNSGDTRLYLNTITDILPKGVYLYSTSWIRPWANGTVNTTDKNGDKVTPVWKTPELSSKYDNKAGIITIDVAGGLSYDNYFDKYYLKPNEGIKICIPCEISFKNETEDYILNTVAMPYFDYLSAGVTVSDDTMKLNSKLPANVALNDGDCEVWDTAAANLAGFTGGNSETQWLVSDVTLTRGEIVPGITKWVESLTTVNGSTVMNTETAGQDDTVNWRVKLTNEGADDIGDWTFTDVMDADYGFTDAVKLTFQYNGNDGIYNSTSSYSTSCDLFTITRDPADLDDVKLTYPVNSNKATTTVSLVRSGEAVKFNHYPIGEITVRIYVNDDGKEVLEFTIPSQQYVIPAGGYVYVDLSTKNYGTWANKVYYNNAYLTPNKQTYDETKVSQGNHLLFGNAFDPTVRNSNQITAAYGYVTSSEKRIREIGNETNCASSRDEKNWIFLDKHKDTFRYTNIVNNITGKPMSKFIMIDNLPEVGDHATFAVTEDRYSAFKVELLTDPKFEVAMVMPDGTRNVLDASQYELMFSDRTEFKEKDWDDSSDEGWYSKNRTSTRSFRISIYDDTGLVIPDGASIQVEYNGKIVMADDYKNDEVTENPLEGTIAWNSFGYHYRVLGETISLEAAPYKVGICIEYKPVLDKSLVYPDGSEYTAEQDETFRFLLYSGAQINSLSGKTEAQMASIIAGHSRKATILEITVKEGKSKSETLTLKDLKQMTYDTAAGEWVEGEAWRFVDNEKYNVIELPDAEGMFKTKNINTSTSGIYSFNFNGMKVMKISAVNERKTWTVRINKTDAAQGKALAGAVFGIYSPTEREAISDEDYNALNLSNAPAKTMKHNGTTWYLSKTVETTSGGAAIFSGLIEDNYIVKELKAPGGYKLRKDVYEFALSDAGTTLSIEKTVENEADYELPRTGTKDVTAMMTWGNILMLAAFAILALKKNFLKSEAE